MQLPGDPEVEARLTVEGVDGSYMVITRKRGEPTFEIFVDTDIYGPGRGFFDPADVTMAIGRLRAERL